MSKMSEIAMELDDQAMELGFESYEEALAKGYEWGVDDNDNAILYNPNKEQEQAHEAWLAQKSAVLAAQQQMLFDIQELKETLSPTDYAMWVYTIKRTIEFIKKGEV